MKYYLNTGDALPNAPIAFGSAPGFLLSNTNVQLLDLDGDGRVELVHMPHVGSYSIYRLECAPVAANQTGAERQCSWSLFGSIPSNPSIDLTTDAAEIRLVDLNGDHLIDVVKTTGTQMQHWLNLSAYPGGEGKFGQVDVTTGALSDQPIRTCVLHKGLPIQFSDSRVKLADMNGDGLQDIVLVDFGSLVYWPNQGYGVWGLGGACPAGTFGAGRYVAIGNAPYYSSQDPTLVRFGDVNGDGLADMMQIRFNAVDVWLNAITEMRDRAILQQTPVYSGITDRVRLADVNGSGLAGHPLGRRRATTSTWTSRAGSSRGSSRACTTAWAASRRSTTRRALPSTSRTAQRGGSGRPSVPSPPRWCGRCGPGTRWTSRARGGPRACTPRGTATTTATGTGSSTSTGALPRWTRRSSATRTAPRAT